MVFATSRPPLSASAQRARPASSDPASPTAKSVAPVFHRNKSPAVSCGEVDGMPGMHASRAQYEQWRALVAAGRRGVTAWANHRAGGYQVPAPDFGTLRGAPAASEHPWTVHKDADGTLDISSLDFPRKSPHLKIVPPTSPIRPATCILDGKTIGPSTSLRDLKMANLLANALALGGQA